MKAFLLSLLWVFAGVPTLAQTGLVRTGEHVGFTRAVVTIPVDADWTLDRIGDAYRLRISGLSDYKIADFFDLIPRDRISDARITDGALMLELACDCVAEAFEELERYLVIDVRAEPAIATQQAFPRPMTAKENQFTLPLVPGFAPILRPIFSVRKGAESRDGVIALQSEQQTTSPQHDLDALQYRVAQSLARAASQGLLTMRTPNTQRPSAVVSRAKADDERMPSDDGIPEAEEPFDSFAAHLTIVGDGLPGVTSQTSFDAAVSILANDRDPDNQAKNCWPPHLLDVVSWGTDQPFAYAIPPLVAAASGEFNRAPTEAVLELARAYVYFGFGREALQTIEAAQTQSAALNATSALARLVDSLPLVDDGLANQLGCGEVASVWAVLAEPDITSAHNIDPSAIARQTRLLPPHLQALLAPRLSERLLRIDGATQAALLLETSLQNEQPRLDAMIAKVALDLNSGDLEAATGVLTNRAATDVRLTPKAVLDLVDLLLMQQEPIPNDILSLIESMAWEYRKQEDGDRFAAAQIFAMLHNQMPDAALERLDLLSDEMDQTVEATLIEETVLAFARAANDLAFLEVAFSDRINDVTHDTQNKTAERLIDLGFPERATTILAGSAVGGAMAERRYLRAEAAMAQGDSALAGSHLAGISTERAVKILTRGDVELVAVIPDFDTTAQGLPADQNGALSTGRRLIEASVATRSTLSDLLNQVSDIAQEELRND